MKNTLKLESSIFRLKDIESLRNLFADLNYEYEDRPVDKQNWNQELKEIVVQSRIVARKDNFLIVYVKTSSDSIKGWKRVAAKIISENNGFCLVCSHNPSGFQWIFSSLSKEFSKSFSEARHVPIEIRPNLGVPKPFLEFFERIRVEDEEKGVTILSKISDAFDRFSLQIHNELTINVFEALKILSEGIIEDKLNGLILSDDILKKIREPIFILLYRIIFVLYAEDRSIFPTENKIYFDKFSLKWVKNNWILKSMNQISLGLNEYEVQDRLKRLFRLIEVGSEELGFKPEEFSMRSYYGRLFDSGLNSELEKWVIPNRFCFKAIELLTSTRDKDGNNFFLDYAALEIRHLGSIYEHLLEYHLITKNKKIADLPVPKDRKSSGSYYTPQYIVEYIVTNTIKPIIDKIIRETHTKSDQIEKILSLNILDPAMGSGHFLVSATDYLARTICQIENKENSYQQYIERKRDVVRRCIYGVDLNPLAVDLAALSLWLDTLSSEKPLSFLNAHLKVGNSLLGSDIKDIFENQTTLVESEKGRDRFLKNIKDFFIFENLEDNTSSAVKVKSEKYEKIRSKGTIFYELKFLLDSKLARSFGVKIPALGDYRSKVGENSIDFYTSDLGRKVKEFSENYRFFHWELEFPDVFFDETGDKKSNPGFDIVISNPPYLRIQGLHDSHDFAIKFLEQNYISATGRYDFYVIFLERASTLLKKEGYLGFILPHKFTNSGFGSGIRRFLSEGKLIYKFLSFGYNFVFDNVTTYTGILILKKSENDKFLYHEMNVAKQDSISNILSALSDKDFSLINQGALNEKPWILKSDSISAIIKKIRCSGPNIMEYFDKILQGLISGDDSIYFLKSVSDRGNTMVFFSDKLGRKVELEKAIMRPIVFGENVKRYEFIEGSNYYVIYPYRYVNGKQVIIEELDFKNKYPLTYSYLVQFKEHLTMLKKKFKTNPKYWYALHRSRQQVWFESEKIISKEISYGSNMTLDKRGLYHATTVYSFLRKESVKIDNKYFLGILNSTLMWFFLKNTGYVLRGGYFRFMTKFLEHFHIPIPDSRSESAIITKVQVILDLTKEFDSKVMHFLGTLKHDFRLQSIPNTLHSFYDVSFDFFLETLKKSTDPGIEFSISELEAYFNSYKKELMSIHLNIEKIDHELDLVVYDLYNISSSERELIRNSGL